MERIGALFLGDLGFDHFGDRFWLRKGTPRGAFWEQKWNQNRTKIEVENEDEKKTLLGAPWIDFGSFWDATWGEKSSKFIGGASIS